MTDPKFKEGQKVRAIDDTQEFDAGTILTISAPDKPSIDDFEVTLQEDFATDVYHRALFEAVNDNDAFRNILQRLDRVEAFIERIRGDF